MKVEVKYVAILNCDNVCCDVVMFSSFFVVGGKGVK